MGSPADRAESPFIQLDCFGKLLVFEIVRCQEPHERIAKEVLVLAIVETLSHLLQVGKKMFHGDFMPRATNAGSLFPSPAENASVERPG